ncbi:MAG: DUF4956 domain-containing protein [Oscillospiraceae bacterium]|nr:DUF4956 domain-containing protein [Oscillospiraceae bacterium]
MDLSNITSSILTGVETVVTPEKYIICAVTSLICGILVSLCHSFKNRANLSFYGTLAFLPVIVMTIVMVVSRNIGAGVAIAGTFTLVRFRSAPGDARAIGNVFSSSAIGILCGLGFLFYAGLFTLIVCLFELFMFFALGNIYSNPERYLRVTIPENLDYDDVFDDIFDEYLKRYELIRIKSVNMGSLFELTYSITSKSGKIPKDFIDAVRTRNGNLSIMVSREIPELTL